MLSKSLYEELASRFGCQVVEPFKESVIIVDAKEFKPKWEEQLRAEGCKILLSNYLGRTCFFVRKPAPSALNMPKPSDEPSDEQKRSEEAKPQPFNMEEVNVEEAVIELVKEGYGFTEICRRLGLTHKQLMGYFSALRRKGVLDKLGWVPARQKRLQKQTKAEAKPVQSLQKNDDGLFKELLEACLTLYPRHSKVIGFLLEKAREMLP